jgi:hypothetical protein
VAGMVFIASERQQFIVPRRSYGIAQHLESFKSCLKTVHLITIPYFDDYTEVFISTFNLPCIQVTQPGPAG